MATTIRPVLFLDTILAQAGNGNTDYTVTRPLVVSDAHTVCTAADSGGNATMTVSRQALGSGGFNALSSAMNCFTLNALTRTTVITVAESVLAATDVLRFAIASAGGGTANGRVWLTCASMPITGA